MDLSSYMLRLSLSQSEAFTVLLAIESFLPEATDSEAEALSNVLGRLSSHGLASPYRTATEARYRRS
jgi:hypothetical protein